MKHTIVLLMAAAISVSAADNKKTAQDSAKEVFKSREFQIESAYTARTEDFDKYRESATIGATYYHTKGAGFHAEIGLDDLQGQGVDLVAFGPRGRLTFDKIRTALLFGVGAEWRSDPSSTATLHNKEDSKQTTRTFDDYGPWSVYAEVGASFRLHKLFEPFVLVRGVRPIEDSSREHVAIMIGASIPLSLNSK